MIGVLGGLYAVCTALPIAQTNPDSSRARAVTVTVGFLPLADKVRYLAHSRVCALAAISFTSAGKFACTTSLAGPVRGRWREVQAPSISVRRTRPVPAFVKP